MRLPFLLWGHLAVPSIQQALISVSWKERIMEECTRYLTSQSLKLPTYQLGRVTHFLHSAVLKILHKVQKAIAIWQMLHRHHFSAESTFKCFISRKLFCSLCWMRKGLSSFACLEETMERNALCKLQSTEHSVAASAIAWGSLGTPGGETQPTPEARPEAKCRESRGGEGALQK